MEYRILTWNINQATNRFGTNRIPELVGESILERKAELVVLTEFCFCKNTQEFLENYLEEQGYDYFPRKDMYQSEDRQNMVLLAWKKEFFEPVGSIEEAAWHAKTTKTNNVPNFARVNLKDKQGIEFTLAGVRITMASRITANCGEEELREQQFQEQATLRREQMEYVLRSLQGFSRVVVVGDFNNYRRGTSCRDWNVNYLNCGLPFEVHTPMGQSIYEEKATSPDYEFPEDHFMTAGCNIKFCRYDRTFTKNDPEIYSQGSNFCLYDQENNKVTWRIPYGCGYPDHAILIGELDLLKTPSNTYVCSKCGREFETNGYSIPPYCDECGDFD